MLSILCVTILPRVEKYGEEGYLSYRVFLREVAGSENENIDPLKGQYRPCRFSLNIYDGARAHHSKINFYAGECRSLSRYLEFTFETIGKTARRARLWLISFRSAPTNGPHCIEQSRRDTFKVRGCSTSSRNELQGVKMFDYIIYNLYLLQYSIDYW